MLRATLGFLEQLAKVIERTPKNGMRSPAREQDKRLNQELFFRYLENDLK